MSLVVESGLRKLRWRPRNRPHEACQFARHCNADLVDVHTSRTQSSEAPGKVFDRLEEKYAAMGVSSHD
jgi:hypothetical protein